MPKIAFSFIGLLCCTVLIFGCKKEGCTDEKALNFDEKAKVNDFSCTYAGEPYIGTYEITDTLYVPMLSEIATIYQKVTIEGTDSDTLYLQNYRNTEYTLFIVLDGTDFTLPAQEIWGGQMIEGIGMFRNDSLFYDIEGDDYDNRGRGGKP